MYSRFHWRAHFAAQVLRKGGVIAHPTEAVWGLACDPYSESAVDQVLQLKGRPVEKGLILLSGNAEHFAPLLAPLSKDLQMRFLETLGQDITNSAANSEQVSATQAITWIVPDVDKQVPEWIRGTHAGVAIRVSSHPLVQSISQYFGGAIISTSANPSGKKPAMSLNDIRRYFYDDLDYVVSGKLGGAERPSKIIDLESGRVLRE